MYPSQRIDKSSKYLKLRLPSHQCVTAFLMKRSWCVLCHRLIVTEKPSVARTISKVLGATARRDGYLEGGDYLISWCVGHLVELAPPGAYDPRLERWDRADLPILPEKWQYLVSSSTKKQFDVLCKLMHRPDVDRIVCATDAGREAYPGSNGYEE